MASAGLALDTKLSLLLVALLICCTRAVDDIVPKLSEERVVFQIEEGEIEFAFYPDYAPLTTAHIFEVVTQGLYTSSDIFRVDKGFVAQTSGVSSRTIPMNEYQKALAKKTVNLEVTEGLRHYEGTVSMARHNDKNSNSNSFSFLLGRAAWLDMQYTVFGKVTRGMETLHELEKLETRKEGIFVMPLKKVVILNSYWYRAAGPLHLSLPKELAPVPLPDVTGPINTNDTKFDCSKILEEVSNKVTNTSQQYAAVSKQCLAKS